EYTAWMRERWNHPSVVIWDAQNESKTPETGKALQAVRSLDLSNRPWENGWAEPQSFEDCVESHPYLFISAWQDKEPFRLKDMVKVPAEPRLLPAQQKLTLPIIVNEYGWLWLTREGEVTSLTGKVYESLLGPDSSIDQRRHIYARYLAALTEFWRSHRQAAGVLHFCGLGYSRAGDKPRPEGGATSDHFLNLENLEFEPYFEKYVRDSFSPVGIMLDFWEEEVPVEALNEVKVYVINDLYRDWEGKVELRLKKGDDTLDVSSQPCRVTALGRESISFTVNFPSTAGKFELSAELAGDSGELIRSVREFRSR
ncbi:MAG TPA: glycoside hydrolase family 2 TIM barrel-domain containing protein, partial [Acidobacteriota bacterium]|nr:glycoside hydrolase family 2 TIM barrel-domain containing protein [Acidobacteriota bacterium]